MRMLHKERLYAMLSKLFSVCEEALHEISLDEWEHPALDKIEDAIGEIHEELENTRENEKNINCAPIGSIMKSGDKIEQQ